MKRDMDLIRAIALKVEELPFDGSWRQDIPGWTHEENFYAAEQMYKSGLVEATFAQPCAFVIFDLTPQGHDFVEAARSDKVWNKAKQTLKDNAGTWTLEALKTAMRVIMEHAAHGHF